MEPLDESEEARTLALIEGTTHYMCVIEGVQAMTGYGIFHDVFTRKGSVPGLSEGYKLIRQDEGRHVGSGCASCGTTPARIRATRGAFGRSWRSTCR